MVFPYSEAPRKIAVCKRSYEEYLQLWSFYYDSLELIRPLAKVLSMTLMTTDMVNCLTIGRKQTRARNPVPCVPFPPSDMLMPNIFNSTKRALQISDFFAVNAPFYDFHKCQVNISRQKCRKIGIRDCKPNYHSRQFLCL